MLRPPVHFQVNSPHYSFVTERNLRSQQASREQASAGWLRLRSTAKPNGGSIPSNLHSEGRSTRLAHCAVRGA